MKRRSKPPVPEEDLAADDLAAVMVLLGAIYLSLRLILALLVVGVLVLVF
jgi:hypothetical protein